MKTLRDQSRGNWHNQNGQIGCPNDDIKTGALQRIADAIELMAKNYLELIEECDMYKRSYDNASKERAELYRRISALQGVITKLKKKAK